MNEVKRYLDNLLCAGDTIVVGCSAGPDSMALLYLLMKLRNKFGLKLICCHVNHNVRCESYDEANMLQEYCQVNDIIFETMTIENYGEDNFHNEARNIRYHFFEEIVLKYQANYLMTAHHGDDLIETVLMRIVRGSTMQGYKGFSMIVHKKNYQIVRPFIYTTKDEILKFDEENRVPYALDKSNFSSKYTRNRYRKEILPFLKNEDSNVHLKFLKYSETLHMYDEFINREIDKIKSKVFIDGKLNISYFKELDEVLCNKIICIMLENYYQDDLVLINDMHTDLIKKLIYSKRANGYVYLPNNVLVRKEYDLLSIDRVTKQIDNYEIELTDYALLPNGKSIQLLGESEVNDNNYCRLSSDDVLLPLHVRTRRSGDKMKLKGNGGTKKVKDIFIDCKIPIRDRDIWPIVVDSKDTIVWIPGLKKSKFDVPKNKKCDIIFRYY